MDVLSNAAAILFLVAGGLSIVFLIKPAQTLLLGVGLLLASVAGFLLAVGPSVG